MLHVTRLIYAQTIWILQKEDSQNLSSVIIQIIVDFSKVTSLLEQLNWILETLSLGTSFQLTKGHNLNNPRLQCR